MKRKENERPRKFLPLYAYTLLILFLVGGVVFIVLRLAHENVPISTSQHKTSTPTPSPTLQGTLPPLFSDTFVDNSKGWSVVNEPGYIRTLHNGVLTLSDTNHNVLVESIPTSTTFTNFSLTTTFTFTQGDENDSVGLYLRGDSNLDHDYRIDIFGNNSYAISKEALNANNELGQTFLVHRTQTTLLTSRGHKNTLSISMKGPVVTMQINGESIPPFTDRGYTHGQIALFVANGQTSSGVTASFHNLVIYPVLD